MDQPIRTYINETAIRMAGEDIALLASLSMEPGKVPLDLEKADVVLFMSPVAAKKLAQAFIQIVQTYESVFGPINTEPNQEAIKRLQETTDKQRMQVDVGSK